MKAKIALAALTALAVIAPAAHALDPVRLFGCITGVVKSPDGTPQMGATVLLFNATDRPIAKVFTNPDGSFKFESLLPGIYSVRVSAPSFVPAFRGGIAVHPGVEGFLNINLATLFSSIELVYLAPGQHPLMSDEWKWVLRGSIATRPVLRLAPSNKPGILSGLDSHRGVFSDTRAVLTLSGGESGISALGAQPDLGTAFALATSIYGVHRLTFSGNLGYGSENGVPTASFRTRYSSRAAQDRISPDVELTLRSAFIPSVAGNALVSGNPYLPAPAFKSVSIAVQDEMEVWDGVRLEYGFSMESVSYLNALHYFSPYARVNYDLGDAGRLIFAYSSGATPIALLQSAFSAQEKMVETMLMEDLAALSYFPRVSLRGGRAQVQRSNNLEIGYRKAFGSRTLSAAYYREQMRNAAVNLYSDAGVFDASDLLPDIGSSAYVFNLGGYRTQGYMASLSQALGSTLTVSVTYGRGSALTTGYALGLAPSADDLRRALRTTQRNWASVRMAGVVPHSGTVFDAAYQWSDSRTLNPVHAYITQGTVPLSGLNLSFRQPVPAPWLTGTRIEATAELRNLLSQGYLPVVTADGRRILLVHTPRAVRGGFNFIF